MNSSYLQEAVRRGNLNFVRQFVNENNICAMLRDAAEYGQVEIINYLIERDPDICGDHYALHRAIDHEHFEVIKLLVERCSHLSPELDDWMVKLAVKKGNVGITKYLLSRNLVIEDEESELLRHAALFGQLGVCKFLIKNRIDIYTEDNSALQTAAGLGKIETVRYLLEEGANVNTCYNEALQWSIQSGHVEAAKLLLQHY